MEGGHYAGQSRDIYTSLRRSPQRIHNFEGQTRSVPLPLSADLVVNPNVHLSSTHHTHTGIPTQPLPNLHDNNQRPTIVETTGEKSSLLKIEQMVGIDTVVLGAKFCLHSCVTYPFVIFSRQCQVVPYYSVGSLVSAPLGTMSVMNQITHYEGIYSWWRGFKAQIICLLGQPFARAILMWFIERQSRHTKKTSNVLNWLKTHFIQLFVSGLPYIACLPLSSFSYMESVQHTLQRTYPSDYEGFREYTLERPLINTDPSKRLPFLKLLVPTVTCGVVSDILTEQLQRIITRVLPMKSTPPSQFSLSLLLHKLWASYISTLLTDLIIYPMRTVMLRLHIQGVPVLVENIETGSGVQYVTTFYSGPIDCIQGIWEAEGITGFYKGVSALILQHVLHGLLLVILWRGLVYWERLQKGQNSNNNNN